MKSEINSLKPLLMGLTVLVSLVTTQTLMAQETSFDATKLKAEYFNSKEVKDGLIFDDKKGNTYKVKNSDYAKGVYIKQDNKWLKHGVFYSVSSGRVTSKTTYQQGQKHGSHESYHSNGKVQFQYTYQNNLKHGKWYQYRDNGTLATEMEYKNNSKEGTKISYHSNGQKQFVSIYVNNLRNGESLQYNDKGKLVARSQYKDGNKVGKTQWYYD